MNFNISWLIGRSVAEVEFADPAFWRFRFDDGTEICPGCPWRLVRSGAIAVSSEDHGHPYGLGVPVDAAARCRALLIGLTVRDADVRDDTRDILLYFDDDTRLEIVPLSSGYESWVIVEPSGRQTLAQGGGNVVTWGGARNATDR
jgi:hypothetical protein